MTQTTSRRYARRKAEAPNPKPQGGNSKTQTANPKQIPNIKSQMTKERRANFGFWSFWSLEFVWSLDA